MSIARACAAAYFTGALLLRGSHVVLSCCSESQRQSMELVHAMLPPAITRAIRDGAVVYVVVRCAGVAATHRLANLRARPELNSIDIDCSCMW